MSDNHEELRRLLEVASPRPWASEVAAPHRVDIDGADGGWLFRSGAVDFASNEFANAMSDEDLRATIRNAALAVKAVNALPSLLDENDRLSAEVAALRAERDQAKAQLEGPAGYPAIIEEVHRALDAAGVPVRPPRPVTARIAELAAELDGLRQRVEAAKKCASFVSSANNEAYRRGFNNAMGQVRAALAADSPEPAEHVEVSDYHCRCGHLRSLHRSDEPMPCKKRCRCVSFESPLPGSPRCEHGQQRAHEYTILGRLPKQWCDVPFRAALAADSPEPEASEAPGQRLPTLDGITDELAEHSATLDHALDRHADGTWFCATCADAGVMRRERERRRPEASGATTDGAGEADSPEPERPTAPVPPVDPFCYCSKPPHFPHYDRPVPSVAPGLVPGDLLGRDLPPLDDPDGGRRGD